MITRQQRRNILTLARLIERRPRPLFDMGTFGEGCGTVACALGHAATFPSLAAQAPRGAIKCNGEIAPGGVTPFAEKVFGDYEIFSSLGPCGKANTPKQWAKWARRWVAQQLIVV